MKALSTFARMFTLYFVLKPLCLLRWTVNQTRTLFQGLFSQKHTVKLSLSQKKNDELITTVVNKLLVALHFIVVHEHIFRLKRKDMIITKLEHKTFIIHLECFTYDRKVCLSRPIFKTLILSVTSGCDAHGRIMTYV
jgi:hypothetical protein